MGAYRILADGIMEDNDTFRTQRNNNDLVIGGSGCGKTRSYVLPNLLEAAGESLIICDTKNSLREKAGGALEKKGYRIETLDFRDFGASGTGWNPFDAAGRRALPSQREQDIISIAAALVPLRVKNDPFWELSARMLVECLVSYCMEYLPEYERHPATLVRFMEALGNGTFARLMEELSQTEPEGFSYRRWSMFRCVCGSDRTYASILAFVAEKLAPLSFAGAERMYTARRRLDFKELGIRKTALFVNVSDTDRAFDTLASLFFRQALSELINFADGCPGGRLAMPVRIILDDFAASARIEDFDKIMSVVRSRGISVSVMLQSVTQFEEAYGQAAARTIINNFDTLLYLGGQDVETAGLVAAKANKPVHVVLQMPVGDAWCFVRGKPPRRAARYDLSRHPLYPELRGEGREPARHRQMDAGGAAPPREGMEQKSL